MGEQQSLDFLDKLTMISVALQMQDHIDGITRKDIMVINQKLDLLIQLVSDSSKDADKRLSSAP